MRTAEKMICDVCDAEVSHLTLAKPPERPYDQCQRCHWTEELGVDALKMSLDEARAELRQTLLLLPVGECRAGIAYAGHVGEYVRAVVDAICTEREADLAVATAERDEARAKVAALEADRDALHLMVRRLDAAFAEYAAHHGPSCDGDEQDDEDHDADRCEACAVDRLIPSLDEVADLVGYDAQQRRASLNIPVNNATQKAG